ncbi:MAG: DUF4355 domain-containing protein [Butyrivibrio sp.]|nr:DUF4355 domain-containing protein [Butyrivibrio sp.]
MEFTAITTQEEFNERIKERLAKQEKSIRAEYEGSVSAADAKKLKEDYEAKLSELNESIKTANEKVANYDKDIAERDSKIKSYEMSALKSKIAHETGLPFEMAARLTGETEDDLRKDAEGLSKLVSSTHGAPPMRVNEPDVDGNTNTESYKKMLQALKKE